jgi:hypothetical protein
MSTDLGALPTSLANMAMTYFSNLGRRVPTEGLRVFNQTPSEYYKLNQPELNYAQILGRLKKQNMAPESFSTEAFQTTAKAVLDKLGTNAAYQNLLQGVHIPFVYAGPNDPVDLGGAIESKLLPGVQKSFNTLYPESHFKAVLQSNSELPGNIRLAADSKYETFIEAAQQGTVVGWYFPQTLQEFDVDSQRRQMKSLPALDGAEICLSGAIDICAAVVGSPNLLISEDFYTPILCMSAYEHTDSRMVLLLKAYGPHLEFWCMTQMLTSTTTQVSEQWTGGLCVFMKV